jgi:hypothetical protein
VKRAEVQLPDGLYQEMEGLAKKLQLTLPDLLRQAAEQMVSRQAQPRKQMAGDWHFPEGHHLGPFKAPVEDWRLLANEAAE